MRDRHDFAWGESGVVDLAPRTGQGRWRLILRHCSGATESAVGFVNPGPDDEPAVGMSPLVGSLPG